MNITVNGEAKTLPSENLSLDSLLKVCEVAMSEMVSVQINGSFVDRSTYSSRVVVDGDSVDFLYFLGGGAR
jgi:sulfur carrier protein